MEERLVTSRDITGELCSGLPDIRIVVHRGKPLLAMMRIATKASGGRANLHQGAVGIGVDIETGETLSAVQDGKACATHPDHGKNVVGIRVPSWRDLVSIAKKAAQVSGLGYTGIDLALDDKSGPKILEINARPGLDIQIANLRGLFTE
ncbi:MAG: hypothetical protein KDK41_00105 [Leptospiraceae bacterium]|nr:hypothetical protein [Leptospiraceae bacterium]MCB1199014.1 hypothetical protein [Leptospiraceae bacterium]